MSFCIFHAQSNTPTHLWFLAWCRVTVPIGVGCAVNTNSFYTPSSTPRAIVLCRSRGNRVQFVQAGVGSCRLGINYDSGWRLKDTEK
jgi:hypothetical protein